MRKTQVPLAQRVVGLSLVATGFLLIAVIFNPKGLVGMPINDRIVWLSIFYVVGGMISIGGYLAAGYDPKKGLEILIIGGIWVLLILPIFYLPVSEDVLLLALGFSPFLALLLWLMYVKLKQKYGAKRETHKK